MKLPAELRTSFRKLLRNHPNILKHVKSKSEVNNLKRDELFELADKLEYDFLSELQEMYISMIVWEDKMKESDDPNFTTAFLGEFEISINLSFAGVSQMRKLRIKYEVTPEWQYACINQKRLKYRAGSYRESFEIEVIEYGNFYSTTEILDMVESGRHWSSLDLYELLDGPIMGEINEIINSKCWDEDQIRRKDMGFVAGDEANAWYNREIKRTQ